MPFQEIVTPSLTDLFVEQMEHMILSGELKPGDRLPTERELASQMRVSLADVQGGIKKLEDYGFLRVLPRKGVIVRDYIREGNLHTFEAILSFSGNLFSSDYYGPLLELHGKLEEVLIREASKHATEEQLGELSKALHEFEENQEVNRAGELAYTFYHGLGLCTGNSLYPMLLNECRPLYEKTMTAQYKMEGREKALSHFREIVRAVSKKENLNG